MLRFYLRLYAYGKYLKKETNLEYTLHVQRLSTGEHRVNAYPTSGNTAIYYTYPSWRDFKSAFSKYLSDPEAEWLDSTLANATYAVDVFQDCRAVTRDVLDELGFK
jgi:hypothetical protein